MLEEFDLVLRNRNASKKTSKPSPLKSQQLTVRREKDDLDTYGVIGHHVLGTPRFTHHGGADRMLAPEIAMSAVRLKED